MSWSILIGVLIILIIILIYSQTLTKHEWNEMNLRNVLSTLSIILGIIWLFFGILYSTIVAKKVEYHKVNIVYLHKSKTKVYVEYNKYKNKIYYKNYSNIQDLSIDTNTIFYIKSEFNMWNIRSDYFLYDTKTPDEGYTN